MRIGIISDTHIPDRASEIPKIITDAFARVDMIIHAGDLVDDSVLTQLKNICPQVKAVRGNMDNNLIKHSLPDKEIFSVGKFKIGLTHGYGDPKKLLEYLNNYFSGTKLDMIIFGHSHNSLNQTIDGILYFNPGSPTDKVFSQYNTYGIVDIGETIDAKIIKL